jgi:hypothetical protein
MARHLRLSVSRGHQAPTESSAPAQLLAILYMLRHYPECKYSGDFSSKPRKTVTHLRSFP